MVAPAFNSVLHETCAGSAWTAAPDGDKTAAVCPASAPFHCHLQLKAWLQPESLLQVRPIPVGDRRAVVSRRDSSWYSALQVAIEQHTGQHTGYTYHSHRTKKQATSSVPENLETASCQEVGPYRHSRTNRDDEAPRGHQRVIQVT